MSGSNTKPPLIGAVVSVTYLRKKMRYILSFFVLLFCVIISNAYIIYNHIQKIEDAKRKYCYPHRIISEYNSADKLIGLRFTKYNAYG